MSKKCINCVAYNTLTWKGPYCENPSSPNNTQRVKEWGTCDEFKGKAIPMAGPARTTPELPVVRSPKVEVDKEGLYTPEELTVKPETAVAKPKKRPGPKRKSR